MKQILQNFKKDLTNNVFLLVELILFAFFTCLSFFFMPLKNMAKDEWIYLASIVVTFVILGVVACLLIKKTDEKKLSKRLAVCVALSVGVLVNVLLLKYESFDYLCFLSNWCEAYKNSSVKDGLYKILDVSDYTPIYSYFLILFAKLGFHPMYSIKYLTLIFSISLSFVLEKIISYIKKEEFSWVRFSVILVLPVILMEYTSWGQCDAIYTTFAMLGFLFALQKKSKLSFACIGLSFSIKLQFLFIVPILFVILIVKDEDGEHYLKWKHIWIAPIMYVFNFLPVLAGRPVLDVLLVYVRQTFTNYGLSGKAGNFLYPINVLLVDVIKCSGETLSMVSTILIVVFTVIAVVSVALILWLILKYNSKHKLTAEDFVFFGMLFAFAMVFFMPKMLDRFYFISMLFSIIYFCISKDRFAKIIPILIQNSLYYMMYLIYYNYIEGAISGVVSVIGVVSALACAVLLILEVKRKYLDVLKNEKTIKEK